MSTTATGDDVIVEDPNGRYQRQALIGRGAFKTVYRALDTEEGLEVAWNQVSLHGVQSQQKVKIFAEISILESVKHPNIMDIYNFWETKNGEYIVFITELCSSGTLKEFLNKVKKVKLRSVKKWAKQILSGLDYLHSRNPPVIHRDLKCDNIFMNANRGEVKIGDLGLSICMKDKKFAVSVIGTPEFMAPELYKEKYDEKIDIYAFGMVMLEMITGDYPYCECENAAQIFMKVINGVKPANLRQIQLQSVKEFIELCLETREKRPSAKELIQHPFLQNSAEDDVTFFFGGEMGIDTSEVSSTLTIPQVTLPPTPKSSDSQSAPKASMAHIDTPRVVLQGEGPSQEGTVQMKLYLKIRGAYKEIKFPFNLMEDTPADVATEMVSELELADAEHYIDLITKGISEALADGSLKAHKVKKQPIPLDFESADEHVSDKKVEKVTEKAPEQPVKTVKQPDLEITHPASPEIKKVAPAVVNDDKKEVEVNTEITLPDKSKQEDKTAPVDTSKNVQPEKITPTQEKPVVPQQPLTPLQIPPSTPVSAVPIQTSPTLKETTVSTSLLSQEEILVLYNYILSKHTKEENEMRERHRREKEEFNKKHGGIYFKLDQSPEVPTPNLQATHIPPVQQSTTVQPNPVQQQAPKQEPPKQVSTPVEQFNVKHPEPTKPVENKVPEQAKPAETKTISETNKPPLYTAPVVSDKDKPAPVKQAGTNNMNGTSNPATPTVKSQQLAAATSTQKPASIGKPLNQTTAVPSKPNDDLMNDMISKNLDSLLGKPATNMPTSIQNNPAAQPRQAQPKSTPSSLTQAINPATLMNGMSTSTAKVVNTAALKTPLLEMNENTAS